MKKSKKKISNRFLAAFFCFAIVVGFLFYKEQIKITIINSFSEASADNLPYHILRERSITSLEELASSDNKVFIFVTSNWCSLCDIIETKFKEIPNTEHNVIIYEVDLDTYRGLILEYNVNNAPAVIQLQNGNSKIFSDVNLDNIEQIIETEI